MHHLTFLKAMNTGVELKNLHLYYFTITPPTHGIAWCQSSEMSVNNTKGETLLIIVLKTAINSIKKFKRDLFH